MAHGGNNETYTGDCEPALSMIERLQIELRRKQAQMEEIQAAISALAANPGLEAVLRLQQRGF